VGDFVGRFLLRLLRITNAKNMRMMVVTADKTHEMATVAKSIPPATKTRREIPHETVYKTAQMESRLLLKQGYFFESYMLKR